MRIKVLVSSSKGNSTLISCNNTNILIDVGINYTKLKEYLDEESINKEDIAGVLITHTHSDHISGLSALVKKTNCKVYATYELALELKKIIPPQNINIIEDTFKIDEIEIQLIHTSHDVISYGYVISSENKSLVYITDTGYLNRKYFDLIKNKNMYIIESNYDETMLMNGPYPQILKQRINSDIGHLSNHMTGKILSKVIGSNTKCIFLAHISDHNNLPELALRQVQEELSNVGFDISMVHTTNKYESTELVEI